MLISPFITFIKMDLDYVKKENYQSNRVNLLFKD